MVDFSHFVKKIILSFWSQKIAKKDLEIYYFLLKKVIAISRLIVLLVQTNIWHTKREIPNAAAIESVAPFSTANSIQGF